MSAHPSATHARCVKLFLLLAIACAMTPFAVHADVLPSGVLEQRSCGAITTDVRAVGTGMLSGFDPITMSAPALIALDSSKGCAAISWETSAPAATFVVVTEFGTNPLAVDISKENYGYTIATPQDNSGNVAHTTVVTGLEAGKTYAYRLVARAHPTAMPVVSEARVLVVQSATVVHEDPQPTPVQAAAPTSTYVSIPAPSPEPILTAPVKTTDSVTAAISILPDGSVATTSSVPQKATSENVVPSASVAAEHALAGTTKERPLWGWIQTLFVTNAHALKNLLIGVFVGLLLFLGYKFVVPLIRMRVKNWTMFGMLVSTLIAILAATFMAYYVTLIAVASFLALLAWYLLTSIPLEDDATSTPTQPKLLEVAKQDDQHSTTKN